MNIGAHVFSISPELFLVLPPAFLVLVVLHFGVLSRHATMSHFTPSLNTVDIWQGNIKVLC